MGVTTGHYEERVALEPWDYGGPEHVNSVPYVVILGSDGGIVDAENGLPEPFALEGLSIAIGPGSALRALLVPSPTAAGDRMIRVRTLGCTDIEGDESCGRWLGRRPGSLLKFLLCRRYSVVHAQDVAEALWGHSGFVSSGTVRQCVHELREKLDAARRAPGEQLVVTRQCGYALDVSVTIDADDFAVHVRRGIAALAHRQTEIATVHLRQAAAMYRGDFLADEPQADWAHLERERLREHMEDALEALAELYLAAGDGGAATACLWRLAEMRPYDVDAHRRMLEALLRQGRHSHAQRCHEAFCARLWRDFSLAPGFALAELSAGLQTHQGAPSPGPPVQPIR